MLLLSLKAWGYWLTKSMICLRVIHNNSNSPTLLMGLLVALCHLPLSCVIHCCYWLCLLLYKRRSLQLIGGGVNVLCTTQVEATCINDPVGVTSGHQIWSTIWVHHLDSLTIMPLSPWLQDPLFWYAEVALNKICKALYAPDDLHLPGVFPTDIGPSAPARQLYTVYFCLT